VKEEAISPLNEEDPALFKEAIHNLDQVMMEEKVNAIRKMSYHKMLHKN
jgi:hypothetical protein